MFASNQRDIGFLGQALDLARNDPDLRKPSLFGLVAGGVGAILTILVAIAVGASLFNLLAGLSFGVAIAGGVLVAGLIIALATAFTSYVTTAYHASLFLWAREAEPAASQGYRGQSAAVLAG